MTRDELISALEELAGAIHDCAEANKKCADILGISNGMECKGDFDIDGDIDGVDFANFTRFEAGTKLDEFASNFGVLDCLNR